MSRAASAGLRDDAGGVSDVLGGILLVGMTVFMAVALGAMLFAFKGPANQHHANLAAALDPGPDGQWGTGNEEVRVKHLGGEALAGSETTIRYTVGTTVASSSGTALGSAFSDGRLTVGETWSRVQSLASNEAVSLQVTSMAGGASQLLSGSTIIAGQSGAASICAVDVLAPTIVAQNQTPADVTTAYNGPVTVEVTIGDNCSGVVPAAPSLHWRVSTVATGTTGYSPIAMAKPAGSSPSDGRWQGTIPARSYSGDLGRFLQHYVAPLTDLHVPANTAQGPVQTDSIDQFTQYKYAESAAVTTGTVSNFAGLTAAGGTAATFAEAAVSGAGGTMTLNANAVASAGAGWLTTANALLSDGEYAAHSDTSPGNLQLRLADPVGSPGTITQVTLRAEVNIAGANNDGWQLQACLGTTCNAVLPKVTGTQADSVVAYDVTAARPGGGSWSWTDITNLEVRIIPSKTGSRDGTWQVDNAVADVAYSPTYGMGIQTPFGAVPSGTTRQLDLSYHVNSAANSVRVEVGTGCAPACTWNLRGTLAATTATTFQYTFTGAEAAAGYQVRFVSTAQDTSAGQLFLDYLRVKTT